MYLWCSYCQKFIGEVAPYDQHDISHGICKKCVKNKVVFDLDRIHKSQEIANLFLQLKEAVKDRNFTFIRSQYSRLKSLSVSNNDIFSGIYQPLLYEIGRLWETRILTMAEEHEVTSTIEEVVSLGFNEIPNIEKLRNSSTPIVLITSTSQNQHILGLRLLEYWLCENGIKNLVIVPGLPSEEILSLAKKFKPVVVGLSATMPSQELNQALTKLVEQAKGSRIVFGGRFARDCESADLPKGVTICKNIEDLHAVLVQCKVMT